MSENPEKETGVANYEDGGSTFLNIGKKFLKNIATVSTIYLFGYFDISIAWLIAPVFLTVFRDEWKRSSDRKRQCVKAAVQNEKNVILSQLGDLPAWVYFPDIERAEWLNKMLVQLWPNLNTYMKEMIKVTIEPKIQETLETYKITGFQFDRLRFGTIPPRIGGIKVYDRHVSRTEIMMDVDLIYAGDCDISFYLKGFNGGIKDFQIHGMMRIIMKPLIPTIPFVGGIQIFFLNKPHIDFNLVGAVDILDIPGISDILRQVIVDQIAMMMVLPNKLPIILSDTVPPEIVKTPEPEGVLRVHVVQAIKLMKKDVGVLGKGKSDPYIVVSMGAQEFRSETINNTVNPKWDFWCEGIVSFPSFEELRINVWDWDPGFPGTENDDFLGRASLKLSSIVSCGELDKWMSLEEVKHGMVHLRLSWYKLSSNPEDIKPAIEELDKLRVPSINSAVLILYIDSVQQLPDARANKRPDPILSITAGHTTVSTGVQFRTTNPVYEQGFTFLMHNPHTDAFIVKITDQKTGTEIGCMSYSVNQLITKENMKQEIEPFCLLKSGPNTKILFSAQLKILKKVHKAEQESATSAAPANVTPPSTPSTPNAAESVSVDTNVRKIEEEIENVDDSTNNDVKSVSTDSTAEEISLNSFKTEEASSSRKLIADQFEQPKSASKFGSFKGSLRKRRSSLSKSFETFGSVELSLRFTPERQRLVVTVHRLVDLPAKDPTDLPDPYVKLYLLPKSKDNKRKTKAIKDTCNPVYEESFEYVISEDEIPYRQLTVSVVCQKNAFYGKNSAMGLVTLDLKDADLTNKKVLYNFEPDVE